MHPHRPRRRLVALSAAVVFMLAAAALGRAQGTAPVTIHVTAKVTPNKAGTLQHPQGVKLSVDAHILVPDDYDPPLVDTVDVWFPKGGRFNGGKYPTCSRQTLSRRGFAGCSKRSIMGHGSGDATADTVPTHPAITVVNGGQNIVYFYTVLKNPARAAAPVPGVITRLRGRWSYKLHVTIPRQLQIVAGIPIRLTRLRVSAGHRDWLATTSCPRDRRWRYHVEVTFTTGERSEYDGSVRCRR